ncbi:MAG: threonine synthase [Armatimonadetes bacterium]|nr:threonine synthase [Armatimonadota bacterium]
MTHIWYRSTRGGEAMVSSARAILRGIAADGGLFVPARFPEPVASLEALSGMDYRALACRLMTGFLTDFTEAEVRECVEGAYDAKFDAPEIAPVVKRAGVHFLELYHGPTLAFKDMALTVLPHLLKIAGRKLGMERKIVILTATSGDTGKAALEGFAGVEGTEIIVFFPRHGVSEVQKRQMITQAGDNTHVIGIEGNFDDAQTGVKAVFGDTEFLRRAEAAGAVFSSANSINVGRLIPQIVYYFHAYLSLLRAGEVRSGSPIHVVVPTGNFGNILAAYYAERLGLPVGRLLCASNRNRVLYEFLRTGVYDRNREFVPTISPSMDILISSNLERLLFALSGEDPAAVRALMAALAKDGRYAITPEMRAGLGRFYGGWASEEETRSAIKEVWESAGYLMDTHTAVGYAVYRQYAAETGDPTPAVVAGTASPFKFARDVMAALDPRYAGRGDFELLQEMAALTGGDVPAPIRDLETRPIRHRRVCRKDEVKAAVAEVLGVCA